MKLLQFFQRFATYTRKFSVISTRYEKMKYLGVAEKNDAAKTIAQYLSNGSSNRVSFDFWILACFVFNLIFIVSSEKDCHSTTKSTSSSVI